MKLLSDIDMGDKQRLQRYEDMMRVRLKKFGYRIVKRKTIKPSPGSTNQSRGFRIVSIDTGDVVNGENYNLSLFNVEAFWLGLRKEQDTEKQDKEYKKWFKKNHAVQMDGGWIITDDDCAISVLRRHIAQHGDFDAYGHGTGGDIWDVAYKAYRPWCCPEFNRVWPVDGNWHNLTDCNLRSDADETTLSDGVIPITVQRRIWHDERRIVLKLPWYDDLFFTMYSPEIFQLLSNTNELKSWYSQTQTRKTKNKRRLYCRIHGKITSFAEVIALFDAGKVDTENITESILVGKKWLRDNKLQVDHLRDNVANNCPHSLAIMPSIKNGSKNDMITRITAPFAFIAVRIGENFRVLLGKFGVPDEYARCILCDGAEQFLECLKKFYKIAKNSGEMIPRPKDITKTACLSQMLQDDGQEYHDGQYNPIEGLLRAEESDFMPYPEIGTL